ncbi:MAG: formate/nitrite transporter family protein [Clostridium argentinense]|uniref:Formate/nitrite transporter family protein n=1 Tax=Clostridium faecium TaxID=2762223 RepID=A0ABR8YV82_9CLOT|nr:MULTISPECIES: formate/nitrite transporter family protein [Clostridium]MBD8047903.1 formate/nitrite transporter family protein [Clostridium faecium]MBS5822505.1 formate/nitrite transporter family protein [Clostridium argentinense]MDU1347944.1 formate/nitrite transporter family protein [Clostridium argentinense]
MFMDVIEKISNAALSKSSLLKKSKGKYLVSSALAGIFVGLGVILIFTIGGVLNAANSPYTKIIMGISFGVALSLVVMAGSDLFTGNNMVMTIGSLEKKVSFRESVKVWIFCFLGNLIGSVLIAILYAYSGLAAGAVAEFIVKTSIAKITTPILELFIRGILCNILVCLAIWCSFKLKEETSKLIMIFWCLFVFITSGFEHSVANMSLLAIGLLIPHPASITIGGYGYNLLIVTIGNMVGGIVFVALAYWYISKDN